MDLEGSLKKLSAFLERPLSEEDLPGLMQHLNIKSFKENASVNREYLFKRKIFTENNFVRRGKIAGNPEMTPEIAEKFDEWIERNLTDTDLKFPYEFRHKMEMYKLIANKQFKK